MQENQNNQPYYEDENEIDIMELISKLWKKRSMIIKWCVAGAVIGLVVGFSIPKTYKAGVILAPETQQKSSGNTASLASIVGMNINAGMDAISADMFPDVVHSTPFIFDLFDLPVQFERKDSVISTTLINYMLDYQKQAWWTPILNFPFKIIDWCIDIIKQEENEVGDGQLNPMNLPEKERDIVKFFAENIIVNVDKKTGKIEMYLYLQDPLVVATVMNTITDNLKDYMSNYRSSKARQDVNNLSVICKERREDYYKAQQAYASYVDSNKNVSLQSAQVERERLQQEMNLAYQVYSQVATNLESARIQEQQAKPVFAIVQPPVVPIKKSAPSKAKILIVFTFLAGCISTSWVLFGDEYWKKLKNNL